MVPQLVLMPLRVLYGEDHSQTKTSYAVPALQVSIAYSKIINLQIVAKWCLYSNTCVTVFKLLSEVSLSPCETNVFSYQNYSLYSISVYSIIFYKLYTCVEVMSTTASFIHCNTSSLQNVIFYICLKVYLYKSRLWEPFKWSANLPTFHWLGRSIQPRCWWKQESTVGRCYLAHIHRMYKMPGEP